MKILFETQQKHFESPSNVISEHLTEYFVNCQEQVLRDRFVCGLYSSGMQKRLLAVIDGPPLKKTLDATLAYKPAEKSTKDMQFGQRGQDSSVEKSLAK